MPSPKMTRAHFNLIASTIAEELEVSLANALDASDTKRAYQDAARIAQRFASVLTATNPQFNCAKFIAACMERT